MKKFPICSAVGFMCLFLHSVSAQYTIDLDFNHRQHLLFESIPCDLRIKNETSRLLLVNDPRGGAVIKVRIWDVRGNMIGETGVPLVKDRMLVPPNEVIKTPIDLVHSFRIREPGNYYAIVDLSLEGKRYVSPKLYFEIVSGVELKKLITYIPPRLFSLRLINRGEGDELLLRVQSEDQGLCYGVYPLGFTMKSYPARLQMDQQDVVHVLHRASPREFLHFQFTSSGVPVVHELLESRLPRGPDLISTASGKLVVEGALTQDLAEASAPSEQANLSPSSDLADRLEPVVEAIVSPADSIEYTAEREEFTTEAGTVPVVPIPDFLAPANP